MNEVLITKEILENAGFEYMEQESKLCAEYEKNTYGIIDFKSYRLWTEDEHPIKLDIDNGWNNRGTKWSLHIDNDACETIGCADIDYTWQFNKLMEVFNSSVRLPETEEDIVEDKESYIGENNIEILDNLLAELDKKKSELIESRHNHSLSLHEREKEYEKINELVQHVHTQFIQCCADAASYVFHKYEFMIASPSNLALLEQETKSRLAYLIKQYSDRLNPVVIYNLMYENLSDDEKCEIKYAKDYATLNKHTLQVELNSHCIEKYILELFEIKL